MSWVFEVVSYSGLVVWGQDGRNIYNMNERYKKRVLVDIIVKMCSQGITSISGGDGVIKQYTHIDFGTIHKWATMYETRRDFKVKFYEQIEDKTQN